MELMEGKIFILKKGLSSSDEAKNMLLAIAE